MNWNRRSNRTDRLLRATERQKQWSNKDLQVEGRESETNNNKLVFHPVSLMLQTRTSQSWESQRYYNDCSCCSAWNNNGGVAPLFPDPFKVIWSDSLSVTNHFSCKIFWFLFVSIYCLAGGKAVHSRNLVNGEFCCCDNYMWTATQHARVDRSPYLVAVLVGGALQDVRGNATTIWCLFQKYRVQRIIRTKASSRPYIVRCKLLI